MCTWKLSCVKKKNADERVAIVLKTKHRRICLNLFVMTIVFVTNYLKESINIDDKCGQRVHVLFFILRTVFDRVYFCLHLFFPVISCPHFPFFSICFHLHSPLWRRPFHYGRRVIAWTGKLNFPRVNPSQDRSLSIFVSVDQSRTAALFNICRKALGHLMQFTQHSIPCRFGLGLSTAFYRLGLSTAFTD